MKTTNDTADVILLTFEAMFLKEIGYEVVRAQIQSSNIIWDKKYFYDYEVGFREAGNNQSSILISGKSLYHLLEYEFSLIDEIKGVRNIIKNIIKELSGDRKIKSFDFID
jgi:recombinational DNA repair protein (RecF pathway)